jgi:hypothetical protein
MRKADNTIVFGSQNTTSTEAVPPSIPIPPPEPSIRTRPLAEDLVDDRSYMSRPERGLAFVAVSLALVGVAAAGTYFFFGSREPVVSTTTTTSAEQPATTTMAPASAAIPAPEPAPAPAPTTTPADLPVGEPVDAVRAPGLAKTQLPREIPGPQLVPTERPQAANQAPAAPTPPAYAAKIQGAKFPGVPTAKEIPSKTPPPGMSDEALERAGYYGNINPIAPTAPTSTGNAGEPRAPSAASTEEPKQFTPPPAPSEVMPETRIKE